MELKYFLLATLMGLLIGHNNAQEYVIIPETNIARLFMASFRTISTTNPVIFCGKYKFDFKPNKY